MQQKRRTKYQHCESKKMCELEIIIRIKTKALLTMDKINKIQPEVFSLKFIKNSLKYAVKFNEFQHKLTITMN
jgi:hypothetical protein